MNVLFKMENKLVSDSGFTQTWWDNNLNFKMNEFLNWIGDTNAESKKFFRKFCIDNKFQFKNILDVGCGPATEYEGFLQDKITTTYMGVDSSKILEELNKNRNVPMIRSNCENIPIEDSTYELVYSRHVLEHQPNFEKVLTEMIRCSNHYIANIFFIKPSDHQQISYCPNENLYHNLYNIQDIENFLHLNNKVKKFSWIDINKQENLLFIEV
jgi:SAM-dependent methyltransferase